MAEIKYNSDVEVKPRKESDWALVAKVWPHKTKKDSFSGRFGVKIKDDKGELKDTFDAISIGSGDPIMIRPNQNRRDGKNDPSHLIFMLKEGKEKS